MTDVIGTNGDDYLDNGAGGGTMTGFAGNDGYTVDNAGDVVVENPGGGHDNVQAFISYTLPDNVEDLYLSGSTPGMVGTGNAENNYIAGGDASGDILYGMAGDDSIQTWINDDTLVGGAGTDRMGGYYGNDTYRFSDGDGQDWITDAGGMDRVVFDATVDSSSVIYERSYNDLIIHYGTGLDQVQVMGFFSPPSSTTDENVIETIEFADGTMHDAAYIATHLGVQQDVFGTDGTDYLDNGTGYGLMVGYGGDDFYFVDNTEDVVVEEAGGGNDYVSFSTQTYTLPDNVENLELSAIFGIQTGIGNDLDNTISISYYNSGTVEGMGGNDTLVGPGFGYFGSASDTFIGGTGDDYLSAGLGDDTYMFAQGDGNDFVEDRGGTDWIVFDGTVSSSSVSYVQSGSSLEIFYGEGNDEITVYQYFNGVNAVETVEFSDGTVHDGDYIAAHLGAAPDQLVTYGTVGDDVIDNGSGAGTMVGYSGNDTYIVGSTADTVIENPGDGVDTVDASASYDLPLNVEKLYLTGVSGPDYGFGNDLSNQIFGQEGFFGSTLDGRGGDDDLFARSAGANTLTGGTGNDVLHGSSGDDSYLFSYNSGYDSIVETGGTDRIVFDYSVSSSSVTYVQEGNDLNIYYDDGIDTIKVEGFFSSSAQMIETVQFADGTVHDADYITANLQAPPPGTDVFGTNDADYLDNGPGYGQLVGYAADDSYIVNNPGDIVVENPDEGADTVVSLISKYTLPENVETLYLYAESSEQAGIGNDSNNLINGPYAGNVTLEGLGGDDVLVTHFGGDNTFVGGTGNDQMYGYFGNDTYMFSQGDGNDIVSDFQGFDRVVFDATVAPDAVTYVQNGGDLEIFYGSSDEITVSSYFYGSSVFEIDFADGTVHTSDYVASQVAPLNVFGTSDDDFLDNGPRGGYLVGFEGNDTYVVDNDGDYVYEQPDGGVDTVYASINYSMTPDVERVYMTGQVTANGLYGNDQDNLIYGQEGAFGSVMNGADGNDVIYARSTGDNWLEGNRGDDTLYGGAGNDTYFAALETGTDTIIGTAGTDKLLLSGAIAPSSVTYEQSGNDLLVHYGVSDEITVVDFFQPAGGTDYAIETVEFQNDGTVRDVAYILAATEVAPVAHDDTFNATWGTPVSGNLLADNGHGADTDANNDVLSVTAGTFATATGASVTVSADGHFTYTPSDDFLGADSFSYSVSDGRGETDTADVAITISAPAGAILGSAAGETISGTTDADVIFARGGNDTVNAGNGADTAVGGDGSDVLNGGNGNDYLVGGTGNDSLSGGNGNDTLYGGAGTDILRGNAGADVFLFKDATAYGSIDVVKDFSTGQGDKIDIHSLLSAYDPLTNALTDFVQIATSGANSTVSVDRDGAGTTYGWTQIATIEGVTGLTDEAALVASGNLVV